MSFRSTAGLVNSQRYRDVVGMLFAARKMEQPYPFIMMDLDSLQVLADELCGLVSWARPVRLVLVEDPDESEDQAVISTLLGSFRPWNIPKACLSQEVFDWSEPCLDVMPIVYFFDRRFLSVGVLLHELAHLSPPFNCDHGSEFMRAKSEIVWAFEQKRWTR